MGLYQIPYCIAEFPLGVGVIGFGNVGGGVVNCFYDDRFDPYGGVVLKTVAVRDLSKKRDVPLPKTAKLTDNPLSIIEDQDIDIVVELMGGTDIAKDVCFKALEEFHLSMRSLLQRGESRDIYGMPYTKDIITLEPSPQSLIDAALAKLDACPKVHGPVFYMPFAE